MGNKQKSLHFEHLKKKWLSRHKELQTKLWNNHQKAMLWMNDNTKRAMVGSFASVLMMTNNGTANILAQNFLPQNNADKEEKPAHTKAQLISDLAPLLPESVEPLTEDQEKSISQVLTSYFNMNVTPVLENKRLNRSYGYIGAEQHLMRYPGDTMFSHFKTEEESTKYYASGMAPGRGAWGYFAQSASDMTEKDIQREKYYIAVQTFLAPGWNENVHEYYNFFKYRKMFVVNAENGKAMIVVIGDAGPAEFTGKQLGGSPEVMSYLERVDGGAKGPVLYFFIDDPEDKIPLGPVALD